MPAAIWKLPSAWIRFGVAERAALYPALYLRWSGTDTVVSRDPTPGQWSRSRLRVLVTDGPLADEDRALLELTSARGDLAWVQPLSGLTDPDRRLIERLGFDLVAFTDPGPLASAPPRRPGQSIRIVQGCAAREAEDVALLKLLAGGAPKPRKPVKRGRHLVVAAESLAAFAEIWPALERRSGARAPVFVTSDSEAELARIAAAWPVAALAADDPSLADRIAGAGAFICACPEAPADSARPGFWARTALFAGAPVIAASHPSLDGLAHLCVMDDVERGLALYDRFAVERLKAAVTAQAFLAERLEPRRIAADWSSLLQPEADAAPRTRPAPARTPLLLVLIDIHQDLDVILPVLLALRRRGEMSLKLVLTDWLVSESPRVLNTLRALGFDFEVLGREAVRSGEQPSIAGVDGVLSAADANVRAHKAGHTLVGRARERGLPTFTLQHGFENIGLTYKDHLHGEGVRFAAETIFTWCSPEGLAPWAAPETRAAVRPVGSPKTAPPPAEAQPLNQGFWSRQVGVFENLHWHRFSDAYREAVIADLERAAADNPETLFLIKPHHAGRWLSRNRERITERDNLVVVDPTDSAWEPHTAPALIASVDLVLTTPSTVALDAARTGRPVAILGYDVELPLYEPLPIVRSYGDLAGFLSDQSAAFLLRNEAFLARARLPGRADHRIAAAIAEALRSRVGRPATLVRS